MTQKERIDLANFVSKSLNDKGGYVKGMGVGKFRLMDGSHNPVRNLDQSLIDMVVSEKIIKLSGIVYQPTEKAGIQIPYSESSKKRKKK